MVARRRIGIAALTIGLSLVLWVSLRSAPRAQIGVVPNAENVRFQLIGNEPIAGPDGRALVRGWSVLMLKDRKAGRCYLAFQHENGIAVEPATQCPE
jgi:hypothetical protein